MQNNEASSTDQKPTNRKAVPGKAKTKKAVASQAKLAEIKENARKLAYEGQLVEEQDKTVMENAKRLYRTDFRVQAE